MAKKVIRPLRNRADYDAALTEIERYFDHEPKAGTSGADRFDLLALVIEDYERKIGRSTHLIRLKRSAIAWRSAAIPRPISAACSARANVRPMCSRASAG